MSTNKSASMEVRLKNSKDLVTFIKDYPKYQPTSPEISRENYEAFVSDVENEMTALKNSEGAYSTERKNTNELFEQMIETSRSVRSEIGELKGIESSQYAQVNAVVKLITGANIASHSKNKKDAIKNLKEGEKEPSTSSVSQLDQKSRLGNFSSLLGIIRSFTFYDPADETLRLASLETMETTASDALTKTVEKERALVNEQGSINHSFNDKGGLHDRARRAKMHVKRKYGRKSPEYKALVNKKY